MDMQKRIYNHTLSPF